MWEKPSMRITRAISVGSLRCCGKCYLALCRSISLGPYVQVEAHRASGVCAAAAAAEQARDAPSARLQAALAPAARCAAHLHQRLVALRTQAWLSGKCKQVCEPKVQIPLPPWHHYYI